MFYARVGERLYFQTKQHRAERLTAMADRQFSLLAGLAERASERRVIEQRVIAKPSGAAWLLQNDAFHGPFEEAAYLSPFRQCNHTNEPRRPVVHSVQSSSSRRLFRSSFAPGPAKRAE